MYSKTVEYLAAFDNQHDFERMCADILNELAYKEVVPIALRGGDDDGKDITFTTENAGRGLVCVTLRKNIDKKFKEDFSRRRVGEYEKYVLFCTAYLTAKQKADFSRFCAEVLEADFVPYDVEALRSLLDGPLTKVRGMYLYLSEDDEKEQKILNRVISFLEDRRVLYNKYYIEQPHACIGSVREMRHFLTERRAELGRDSELAKTLGTMLSACRRFLNVAEQLECNHRLPRLYTDYNGQIFYTALGAMREAFGRCLDQISSVYKIGIEGDLATLLLPTSED